LNALEEALDLHRAQGTFRSLTQASSGLDFSSNDYLGLSRCPKIRRALIRELEEGCPLGATGSRLLSGHRAQHERVEAFLASTYGSGSALLFSSGFLANLGVLKALDSLGTEFFSDEKNHASLVDGMRLSGPRKQVFRHNDLNHLADLLAKSTAAVKTIVTESVFSMDGDLAPLSDLLILAERHGAWLVVDEAHATGLFGLGRMTAHGDRLVAVHTGGKALGGQGAYVLSSLKFRDLLINRARSFIFSTALSPLSALQIEHALRAVLAEPKGAALLQAAEEFRAGLRKLGLKTWGSSQIVPLRLGSNERALVAATDLRQRGFDLRAVRSPAVSPGSERLRITLKSFHQPEDLRRLTGALAEVCR
jgi:8-amino-7-oxononanoate synthase